MVLSLHPASDGAVSTGKTEQGDGILVVTSFGNPFAVGRFAVKEGRSIDFGFFEFDKQRSDAFPDRAYLNPVFNEPDDTREIGRAHV